MTALLRYLVERSVRDRPPAAAVTAPSRADVTEAGTQDPAGSPDMQRGVLRPRSRSRHEPWPEFGPPGDALSSVEETPERLPQRDGRMPAAEQREEPFGHDPATPIRTARFADQPTHSAQASSLSQQGIVERQQVRQPRPETPSPVETAATIQDAPRRQHQDDAAALAYPPAVTRDHQAPDVVSANAEPVQPPRRTINAELVRRPHESNPQSGARTSSAVTTRTRDAEGPAPARRTMARAEETRAVLAPSGAPQKAHPVFERPAAPRIEVSIGRVEVRAVYAPPPPARKPPSLPSTSLDDYLKQRDRTG
jgi:hypothetical protein